MVATSDQFLVPTPIPVPHLTPTRLDVQLVELILKRNGKKYTRVHLKASCYILRKNEKKGVFTFAIVCPPSLWFLKFEFW